MSLITITDSIETLMAESKLKSKCQRTKFEKQHTAGLKRTMYREMEYYQDIVKELMQYRKVIDLEIEEHTFE